MPIIMFPMLTSPTVSPNIIPGLCKAMEKHILMYSLDSLLDSYRSSDNKGSEMTRNLAKIVRKECAIRPGDLDLGFEFLGEVLEPGSKNVKEAAAMKLKEEAEKARREAEKIKEEAEKARREAEKIKEEAEEARREAEKSEEDAKKRSERDKAEQAHIDHKNAADRAQRAADLAKDKAEQKEQELKDKIEKLKKEPTKLQVGSIDGKSLALEPTFQAIPDRLGGGVLGIKVVAHMLESDSNIARSLIQDASLNFIKRGIKRFSRYITKAVFRLFYNTWLGTVFFIKRRDLKGDAKADIILDRSIFSGNKKGSRVMTCLSKADLEDDLGLFEDAGGVRKLFSLGWTSIVITDDVNKRAIFCPKEQRGVCAIIPYSMIYSSVSYDAKKIFDDLEDIKKSAAPIFRRKIKLTKLLGGNK